MTEKSSSPSTPTGGGGVGGTPKSSEIRKWLESVSPEVAERYGTIFENEAITLQTAALLEEDDLRDLGIRLMGHRKLLLEAIRELKVSRSPLRTSAPASSSSSNNNNSPPKPLIPTLSLPSVVLSTSPPQGVSTSNSNSDNNAITVEGTTIEDVNLEQKIGEGSFGAVYKAFWHGNPVAAKRTKEVQDTKELLVEAQTCLRVRHPNCVTFYGIFKATDTGFIYLVTEFCEKGALDSLLQDEKQASQLQLHTLLGFLRDSAAGMVYLATLGIVHRDLASRNILLKEKEGGGGNINTNNNNNNNNNNVNNLIAKVSDFGLSRVLGQRDDYYHSESGVMPIRWCAPEALRDKKFSSASDVWSYGILCWEVFNHAKRPYDAMAPKEILPFLDVGGRLQRPENCPEELYGLMNDCWKQNEDERPSFRQILNRISEMLEKAIANVALLSKQHQIQHQNAQQQRQLLRPPQNQTSASSIPKSVSIVRVDTTPTQSLQQIYEKSIRMKTPDSRLEYSIALFQFGDIIAAYEELTTCIEQAQCVPPAETKLWVPVHFVRGYFNTRLGDFSEATSDFVQAHSQMERSDERTMRIPRVKTTPIPDSELPIPEILTVNDVINAAGHATFLLATQGNKTDQQRIAHLDDASSFFLRAISSSLSISSTYSSTNSTDPCGIVSFNLAQSLYFRSVYGSINSNPNPNPTNPTNQSAYYSANYTQQPQQQQQTNAVSQNNNSNNNPVSEEEQKLIQALKWYENALANSSFPIPADAHAMKAKTLARLGRIEQAKIELKHALEIDPEQRQIDLESQIDLRAPPIPPRDEITTSGIRKWGHQFVHTHFGLPTWCDLCCKLIVGIIGKQGYKCSRCGYIVHANCFNFVRTKICLIQQQQATTTTNTTSTSDEQQGQIPTSTVTKAVLKLGQQEDEINVPQTHIHRFRDCNFHKPKWCKCCNEYITTVYGKQCIDCKASIHRDCFNKFRIVINLIPEDQLLSSSAAAAPSQQQRSAGHMRLKQSQP